MPFRKIVFIKILNKSYGEGEEGEGVLKSFVTIYLLSLLLFVAAPFSIFGATTQTIDFFGVASPDAQESMIRMTSDLYFNQLKDCAPTVRDKRNKIDIRATDPEEVNIEAEDDSALIFWAFIKKRDDGKWVSIMFLINCHTKETFQKTTEYDSYYKILMESKSSLVAVLDDLIFQSKEGKSALDAQGNLALANNGESDSESLSPAQTKTLTLDELCGTWNAESFISKAVIMRNGKGFIIFRNGVSMNVSITKNSEGLLIKQLGNSNAAYYPEMERAKALEAASMAQAIEWSFTSITANRMIGKKRTLALDSSSGAVTRTFVDIEWTK